MGHTGNRRIWLSSGLALVLLMIGLGVGGGYWLVIDSPRPSDVILVLAGETDSRPLRALQLLDQQYGRRIVLDVPAEAKIYGVTYLELAQRYILRLPQAASITICPIEGLSTRDESLDAEKCMHDMGDRVLIVTSDFHTRRALSIFRRELRNRQFSVAAARDNGQFGERWWTHREWAKTFFDEALRVFWWNAVDRWR